MTGYSDGSRASRSNVQVATRGGGLPGAWADLAEALADWALSKLVVRKDVHGAYNKDGSPWTCRDPLTRDLLIRHFQGEVTIGAHSISTEGKCLTVAWD